MVKIAVTIWCILISTTLASHCPFGWVNFGESCYYVYDYPLYSYEEAEIVCTGMGSTLVNVNDADENLFLKAFTLNQYHIWIGLQSEFIWADRSLLTYSNWMSGDTSQKIKCVHLYSNQHGKWRDIACSNRFGFICEREAF
ncbi:low affinity immunoglobulin epsilon Fc receptor-like [Ptychodera flava]|uniref:low affinity immunoglobulin epsilon Fc receptor-like n=1 Tax=Ptychodera flava TaxID=63121 RepID=UPI00396A377F